MKSKKGFFYSIMVIAIIVLLAALWLETQHSSNRLERAFEAQEGALFVAFTRNQMFSDVSSITDVHVDSDGKTIKVYGGLPATNPGVGLTEYNEFIQNWSSRSHVNITLDSNALSDGVIDAMLYNTSVKVNYSSQNNISLSNLSTDYMVINISSSEERISVDDFAFGVGSTNLTLIYSDVNGTVTQNGMVDLEEANDAVIRYDDNKEIIIQIIPRNRLEILSNVSSGSWSITYNQSRDDRGSIQYPVDLAMFYNQIRYRGGVWR